MTHRQRFIVIALVLGGWPNQSCAQTSKSVGLQVRSESWIANSGFDRAAFTRQCAGAGVNLVPEAGPDGLIVVEYTEAKGSGYSMFGIGTGGAWGTNITYKLNLLSPTDGSTLLTMNAVASTPSSGVAASTLHQAAVDSFKSLPQYRLACTVVAALLGSRTEAEKLLPWAVHHNEGLKILEKAAFAPSTQRDRAFLAVARREWTGLQQFGNVAAEPLRMLIQSCYKDIGFGQHHLHSTSKSDLAGLGAAVGALAATGDSGAAKIFEDLLKECSRWRRDMVKPVVIPTLSALGKVGNAFSLSTIDAWTGCDHCDKDKEQQAAVQEIALVATDAAKNVRARLVKKQ